MTNFNPKIAAARSTLLPSTGPFRLRGWTKKVPGGKPSDDGAARGHVQRSREPNNPV